MTNTLKLTLPTSSLERAALDMRKEFFSAGESVIHGGADFENVTSYSLWLKRCSEVRTTPPPGRVPSTEYFATVDGKPVGMLNIRHELNDDLLLTGGHIGYSVRPSMRGRGYATQMLALAVERCASLGISNILVTCNVNNKASARVIEKNGGILENEVTDSSGTVYRRYWIKQGP